MQDKRLPVIPPGEYDADQARAADSFRASRNVPVFGPFERLLHSPEVMSLAGQMGEYLRYRSAIGTVLSELVILIVAREWSQDYEWYVHAPIAVKQGIGEDIVDAIADGRRPARMSDDEAICYDFSVELQRNKRISDTTYGHAETRFGHKGVVDLVALNGYYGLLAMAMNTARMELPPGATRLPRFPD